MPCDLMVDDLIIECQCPVIRWLITYLKNANAQLSDGRLTNDRMSMPSDLMVDYQLIDCQCPVI